MNIVFRFLAVMIGVLLTVVPVIAFVKSGRSEMWFFPIIGLIFLIYGVGGNKMIKRIRLLSSYGEEIGKK